MNSSIHIHKEILKCIRKLSEYYGYKRQEDLLQFVTRIGL